MSGLSIAVRRLPSMTCRNGWYTGGWMTMPSPSRVKKLTAKATPLDYSGHECEFLAAHVESVTPLQPSGYRLPVAVGGLEIAEYGVVETGAQGVDYFGAHGEIHVGNP